jgi:type III secretory pathway component EscU
MRLASNAQYIVVVHDVVELAPSRFDAWVLIMIICVHAVTKGRLAGVTNLPDRTCGVMQLITVAHNVQLR